MERLWWYLNSFSSEHPYSWCVTWDSWRPCLRLNLSKKKVAFMKYRPQRERNEDTNSFWRVFASPPIWTWKVGGAPLPLSSTQSSPLLLFYLSRGSLQNSERKRKKKPAKCAFKFMRHSHTVFQMSKPVPSLCSINQHRRQRSRTISGTSSTWKICPYWIFKPHFSEE